MNMNNINNTTEDLKELLNELNELKRLRSELEKKAQNTSKEDKITELKEKTNEISKSNELLDVLKSQLDVLNEEIEELQKDLEKSANEYAASYTKLSELNQEELSKYEEKGLLGEDKIKEIKEEYEEEKLKEYQRSLDIINDYRRQKKLISGLRAKRTRLKKDIEKAEALDLDMEEYRDITDTLRKNKIVDAILAKKGLNDIIAKPSKERTKEEKELLKATKEEIMKEISEVKKVNNYSALDAIEALYSLDVSYVKGKTRVIEIPKHELEIIKENVKNLPVMFIDYNKVEEKVAAPVPEDLKNISEEVMASEELKGDTRAKERIKIFKDKTTGDTYIRKFVREERLGGIDNHGMGKAFELDSNEKPINIKGLGSVYKISKEMEDFLRDNKDNEASPYIITDVELENIEIINPEEPTKEEPTADDYNITNEEYNELVDNGYVPGTEDFEKELKREDVNVFLADALENVDVQKDETENENSSINNQEETLEEDSRSYILEEEPLPENSNEKLVEVERSKHKPRVHKIISDITTGIEIKKKDGKRYTASNIKIAREFKEELSSGNVIYNIAHMATAIIKLPIKFISKFTSKLLLLPRGKAAMESVNERLRDLSEEELEVLFNEYKGVTVLSDMNTPILPLIQNRIREWVMKKVDAINEEIKVNYVDLFITRDKIDAINNELDGMNEEEKRQRTKDRKLLYQSAAYTIKNIEDLYQQGKDLLSGGLHGMEEDFRAATSKMSLVGFRFAKSHNLNNELIDKIGEYDDNIGYGFETNDYEKVYNNFMKKEQCFIDNTEVKDSIFGERSVGEKYHMPYVEQLNYKDDPLIKDLLTTVAMTTAAISVVNSIRVHKIESDMIEKQQQEAASVNAANDNMINNVNIKSNQIVSQRETIQKGLEEQMHEDVLNSANGLERYALDKFGWSAHGKKYHALDDANHVTYNSLYGEVSNGINKITNELGAKSITKAEALQDMAVLANDTQNSFVDIAKTCLNELNKYMVKNPKYDLTATKEALEYIVNNPTAITEMNEAAINATNIAEEFVGLTPAHVTALGSLPSDWVTTLVGAAGSAALAHNICRTFNDKIKGADKVKDVRYRNDEIGEMFYHDTNEDDYIEELEEEEILDEDEEYVRHR